MRRTTDSSHHRAIREEGLEALEALGNEHRIAILRTLADADGALTFSELRERVGIDDAGRFNYHLNKLRGQFVRRAEAGYELGYAGERVVLAAADIDPETVAMEQKRDTEEQCPICGESDCGKLIHVHLASK